jgi:hypothetical protein
MPNGVALERPESPRTSRLIYLLHIAFYIIDTMTTTAARWLARVQHDLVKRLVWPARDRRDLGGTPSPGELLPHLIDDAGAPTTAMALWAALAADSPESPDAGQVSPPAGAAPPGAAAPWSDGAALTRFGEALTRAIAAGQAGDVAGVLALESAFAELARSLDQPRR